MALTGLTLAMGDAGAGFRTLRLAVAPLFTLVWAPLQPDRSHVTVYVHSPCCAVALSPDFDPGPHATCCSRCGRGFSLPPVFHLSLVQDRWTMEPAFAAAVTDLCEPLTATVVVSEVEDLMHELMARASGEYAWQPEGNLRGARVLSPEKQLDLCRSLLLRFGGDVRV